MKRHSVAARREAHSSHAITRHNQSAQPGPRRQLDWRGQHRYPRHAAILGPDRETQASAHNGSTNGT